MNLAPGPLNGNKCFLENCIIMCSSPLFKSERSSKMLWNTRHFTLLHFLVTRGLNVNDVHELSNFVSDNLDNIYKQ